MTYFFFGPRFSRQERPQTRFLWRSSMTCCIGLMPKTEWCAALVKSMVKTAMFSWRGRDNLLVWRRVNYWMSRRHRRWCNDWIFPLCRSSIRCFKRVLRVRVQRNVPTCVCWPLGLGLFASVPLGSYWLRMAWPAPAWLIQHSFWCCLHPQSQRCSMEVLTACRSVAWLRHFKHYTLLEKFSDICVRI